MSESSVAVTTRSRWLGVLVTVTLLSIISFRMYRVVHAQAPAPSELAVYSQQTAYKVPLIDVKGQSYIGLAELLEPLGPIEAKLDGKKYKLRLTVPGAKQVDLEFHDGKDKGKVRGDGYKLPANFVVQDGRGYVPLAAVTGLLVRMGLQPAELHIASSRLFIGNVAQRFTLELKKGTPSRLLVGFSAPVNPTIGTEPGGLRLTFRRDPVTFPVDHLSYDDPLITGAAYSELGGVAELNITSSGPLMANFADGGKTIIISAAPAPALAVAQPVAPAVPQLPVQLPSQPLPSKPAGPRFLVLIDPAHGGSEIGAAITPQLPEKDVVLALARRLQRDLGGRGITSSLLRSGDNSIPLDQRAISANAARPALYIALHAANTGKGVHVYTALLPAENLSARGFLPWDSAQAAFTDLSNTVAGSVAAELEARKLPNATLPAPLRPMNNIAAPAIAVEIAPPSAKVADIASAAYQEQVAQSIAAGVAAIRPKLPEVRP